MISGLLFLAFAYFMVGQAAFTRNGAQTAADAAALAAAQDARDQLRRGWFEVIRDPDQWGDFVQGTEYKHSLACDAAADYAAANHATLPDGDCQPLEPNGFRVTVTTTGAQEARASALAVIEQRCDFTPYEPPTDPPSPPPTSPPTDPDEEPSPIAELDCGGESWEIDPDDPELPPSSALFTVRLIDE
ncbi:pilus assembly protein TadG-related protein [Streptomyces sp. NPDC020807]|uniref:pilus assembly protein TadG-related protein n=1 Tax=Streptomyces sp. NPDC020807 TaxID=3155119 RepID=UPI0033DAF4BF